MVFQNEEDEMSAGANLLVDYYDARIRKFECMKVFPIYQPRVNSQRTIVRLQYY